MLANTGYIGSIDNFRFLVNLDCMPDPDYQGVVFSKKLNCWFGFSHRTKVPVRIGDRIFEENFEPTDAYYSKQQWAKFEKDRERFSKRWGTNTDIKNVIPYNLRGHIEILIEEEARESARNISHYLS